MARPKAGQDLNIAQLEEMLQDRRSKLHKLEREREKLMAKVEAIDAEIHEMGGEGRARGSGRVQNEKSLIEYMADVMAAKGDVMKVADITAAVLAAGYKTNSANFRGIVNQTLIKDKQFTQASRGLYQLKK